MVPALEDVAFDDMKLPITGFGNVTTNDAYRIVDALTAAAADWVAPLVHFAGGTALEFPGDRAVWAKLEGELGSLTTITRGVTGSVESLGLFVDRRAFRPMLAVATVTEATTGSDLDDVVAALNGFRGQDWLIDCVVLTADTYSTASGTREFQRIALQ